MNAFRFTADMSHLLAMVVLIIQMLRIKSCAGLSGKTQVFFLLVFISRYIDLFYSFISAYNTGMKILYISLTIFIIFLIFVKYRDTYDRKNDLRFAELLVLPVLFFALLINREFSAMEVLWTFSIYLEAIAIVPQVYMISKTGEAASITRLYLLLLGIYRALYLINWAWRYHYEAFLDWIVICAGCVQTLLYLDFFYLYCTKSPLNLLKGDEEEEMYLSDKI